MFSSKKCCLCINKKNGFICKICNTHKYLKKLSQSYVKRATGKYTIDTEKYLGCDIVTLKKHLDESLISGMNWMNHGVRWHIDHTVPICYKDGKKKVSVKEKTERLCYTNMKAMWAEENLSKGCRYINNV